MQPFILLRVLDLNGVRAGFDLIFRVTELCVMPRSEVGLSSESYTPFELVACPVKECYLNTYGSEMGRLKTRCRCTNTRCSAEFMNGSAHGIHTFIIQALGVPVFMEIIMRCSPYVGFLICTSLYLQR